METLQPSEVLQTDTDAHSPQLDPAAPTVDQKLTPEAMSAVPTAPLPEPVAIPPQVSGIGNVQDETLSESPAVVGEIVELGAPQGQAAQVMSCGLEEGPATIASEPASPTIAHGSVEDSTEEPAPLSETASITIPESEPSCDVPNACDNAELLSRAPGIDIDMERQPSPAATDTAQGLQVAETAPAAAASAPVEYPSASAPQESTAEPPAVPASPPPASDGGIRILWDDSSGKRIDASSSVGMLGRWLKRSGEEDSQAPAKQESAHEMAATPTDARREIAASAVDVLFDRPSAPRPTSVEEPVAQPKLRKPMGRRAASRVRMAATLLLTTCFSTTRSVVLSLVALVALAVACTAVVIGAAGLTWVVIEERANTSFQNMTSVPQRSLQDATKNGYFLLLGFNGPTNQDPLLTGFERKVDESDAEFARWCLGGEGNAAAMRQGASADVVTKWFQTVDPAKQIKAEAASVKSWTAQADVSMTRYRQWLKLPFEDWGYGEGASPNCSLILYAHRLYVAEGFAQDQDMGVERLEADLGAWRAVLGHAKSLPVKMLASTAMNDDVAVISGLLLRPDLDERLLGRLTKMARPLDQVEQSMRWPMQSQFIQATKALDQTLKQDKSESRSLYASLAAAMPLPKQRRFNDYAEYYEAAGKVASEGRYSNLPKRAQFVRSPAEGPADYFLNPIENIIGVEPLPAWETYGGRVLETDARLRLAGLQAWLRRTPPEQDLLTRIAKAGQSLYDPFTGLPMLVNLKRGLFYSVGQDLKDNDAFAPGDVVAQIPLMAGQEIKRNSKAK
jgi:hypothetical protein